MTEGGLGTAAYYGKIRREAGTNDGEPQLSIGRAIVPTRLELGFKDVRDCESVSDMLQEPGDWALLRVEADDALPPISRSKIKVSVFWDCETGACNKSCSLTVTDRKEDPAPPDDLFEAKGGWGVTSRHNDHRLRRFRAGSYHQPSP